MDHIKFMFILYFIILFNWIILVSLCFILTFSFKNRYEAKFRFGKPRNINNFSIKGEGYASDKFVEYSRARCIC